MSIAIEPAAAPAIKPYYQSGGVTIYHGDNVAVMQTMPSESIDLVVTSPPYDNLRTYGGHTWDFEAVAAELSRLLKPGGVIVWVVADATVDGSETGTSFRQALHFMDIGLRLHDTMIYKKQAVGACGSNKAYWQEWEYMLVLSLGGPKSVNRIKDRINSTAGTVRRFSRKCDAVGSRQNRDTVVSDVGIRGNVWEYPCGMFSASDGTSHPAPFPESLARDHILSWSNEGDTVLDCFGGSGTTAKMAKLNGRKCISIDCNKEYCDIQVRRVAQEVLF